MIKRLVLIVAAAVWQHSAFAQTNQENLVIQFMEGMKEIDDLSVYFDIPDTLNDENLRINFVSVESYKVESSDGDDVYVVVNPGIGKKCVYLTFVVDSKQVNKLKHGDIRYNERAGKYFLDPWTDYENRCKD